MALFLRGATTAVVRRSLFVGRSHAGAVAQRLAAGVLASQPHHQHTHQFPASSRLLSTTPFSLDNTVTDTFTDTATAATTAADAAADAATDTAAATLDLAGATDAAEVVARGVAEWGEVRDAGLGSFATPVGLVQNFVEALSVTTGLPWVGAIVLTTVAFRVALFPVVVGAMRNNIALSNIRPEMQLHSERLSACSKSGDQAGAEVAQRHLQALWKEHKCHPMKSFVAPLVQAPVFISFFLALRGMANLPVESLKNGGMFWFTDLTVADPYYLLPATASLTMLATIEFGAEGVKQQQGAMKTAFRCLALAVFPITMHFPAAIFSYWVTNNAFSLSQLLFIRIPAVKRAFDIPDRIDHPPEVLQAAKSKAGGGGGGFIESVKSSFSTATEEAARRQREKQAEERLAVRQKLGGGPGAPGTKKNPRSARRKRR